MFLAPSAERQRSFSNAELSVCPYRREYTFGVQYIFRNTIFMVNKPNYSVGVMDGDVEGTILLYNLNKFIVTLGLRPES